MSETPNTSPMPDDSGDTFDQIAATLFDVEVSANDLLALEGTPVGAEYFVKLDPKTYSKDLGGLACLQQYGTSVDDSSVYD